MPRSSNYLSLARQWEMLKRLPSRAPGITARQLVEGLQEDGFTVTKRTVERDLVDLSGQFGIACNDEQKPFGWYWLPGANMDFSSIELTDAVSLSLAEQLLMQMLPTQLLTALKPKFEQARKKLATLDGHPMAKLTQKVRYIPTNLELRPPSLRDSILSTIQEALLHEQQLKVRYARFNDHAREYTLNALSLIQRGTVPYLIATVEPYDEPRIFAIHRFEKVEGLASKANLPVGYSVDQYIKEGFMHFGPANEIELKAKLSNELATYLAETPISDDQDIQHRSGQWQLKATVHDTWQLHFWILSQGAEIQILTPKALQSRIRETIRSASKLYQNP